MASIARLYSQNFRSFGQSVEIHRNGSKVNDTMAMMSPKRNYIDIPPNEDIQKGDIVYFKKSQKTLTVTDVERHVECDEFVSFHVFYKEAPERSPQTVINNHGVIARDISGSAIQQHSPGATQNLILGSSETERLKDAIKVVLEALNALELEKDDESVVRVDLETVKAQLESPKPKTGFVKGLLGDVWKKVKDKAIEKAVDPTLKLVADAWKWIGDYTTN